MPKAAAILLIVFVALRTSYFSQADSERRANKSKKIILVGATGLLAGGSLIALNRVWYNKYNTGSFHFFNDNREWLQMDKVGHAYTSYQVTNLMMKAFKDVGYSRAAKFLIGGSIGLIYLSTVEVMDGFSGGWGFSWGDEAANVFGAALAIFQEARWKEQRFHLKFFYTESGLARYNPRLLGKNLNTKLLKDYNAQTYWFSFSPFSFHKKKNGRLAWLSLSLGYGAYGMLNAFTNNIWVVDNCGKLVVYERERRFYLSLDVDFTKIKTKSKVLKKVFVVLNMFKLPAPTFELRKDGTKFHYLFY